MKKERLLKVRSSNSIMDSLIARNNILLKISRALKDSTPMPFPSADHSQPVFKPGQGSLAALFEKKFIDLLGQFYFFDDVANLRDKLHELIKENQWIHICSIDNSINQLLGDSFSPYLTTANVSEVDAAITDCIHLVAQTGTIVLGSDQSSGRVLPVYTPVHIVIAHAHQLLPDLKECFQKIMINGSEELPSSLVFASGPSRTGDIEKTLVVGVHGPKEVYVLMIK